MGLFGIAIGKKATAAKAAVKVQKIVARQTAKTDRTTLRQDAKVKKATVKSGADIVAYENGVVPQNNITDITGVVSQGIKAVAGFFGGGTQGQDQNGNYERDPQVSMAGGVTLSSENVGGALSSKNLPFLAIGAVVLLMMLKRR